MNSVWKGAISFGLVSVPVQLFSATGEHAVPLREVHAQDGGRIRYRRVCSVDGEDVEYSDVAKGYELPDGDVVVLGEEDLAGLPLSTSRVMDVLCFVDAETIDPIQLSRSYFCEPIGSGVTPYSLLAQAMQRTGKRALVKITLRQRESLAMLRPRDGLLVLHLLLWPDEVRHPHFSFLDDPVPLEARELQVAERYIEALTGEIDREHSVDRYRVALQELVEAKIAGRVMAPQPAAPATGQGDLVEVLRRSVEEAQRSRAGNGVRKADQPATRTRPRRARDDAEPSR
jgi:DNA end-binding protein Ku